jgi:hypothetical protein
MKRALLSNGGDRPPGSGAWRATGASDFARGQLGWSSHQGKVKTHTLANISDWDPARIEALRRALRGDFDHLATADPTLGPVFGLLFALKQVAEELGIITALGKSRLAKLGLFVVLVRLAHQGSRLSAVRWAEDHAGQVLSGRLTRAIHGSRDLCTRQDRSNVSQSYCAASLRHDVFSTLPAVIWKVNTMPWVNSPTGTAARQAADRYRPVG